MSIFALSDTAFLNDRLLNILSNEIFKRNNQIAYISSTQQIEPQIYYYNAIEEFKKMNNKIQLKYFDLYDNYSDDRLNEVFNFGTILLSGGNTFEFINLIRKRFFNIVIKKHLHNKGLLIGVSAGAIVLTSRINIAITAGDINSVFIEDLNGLKILPFEFFPHFLGSKKQYDDIINYSYKTKNNIYVCSDSDGIFYENNHIHCIGNLFKVYNGSVYKV